MESMTQKSNWFEVQTLNLKILEIMHFKCYRKLIEGVLHIISFDDVSLQLLMLFKMAAECFSNLNSEVLELEQKPTDGKSLGNWSI